MTPSFSNQQKGFTLIEILISIVIVGILAASMVYLLSSQSRMSANSSDKVRSFGFAKQSLDSLKVVTYDSLASGSDTVDSKFLRTWHVTATQGDGGILTGRKKIELTVYWPLTGDYSVSLSTLISDDRFKVNL